MLAQKGSCVVRCSAIHAVGLRKAAAATALARDVSGVKKPVPSARAQSTSRPASSTTLTVIGAPISRAFACAARKARSAISRVISIMGVVSGRSRLDASPAGTPLAPWGHADRLAYGCTPQSARALEDACPAQVPALLSRRLSRRDLHRLGAQLQMADARALAGSARPRRVPPPAARRRVFRNRRSGGARRAALAPQHDLLVREDGAARCRQGARGRARLCRGPLRAPAWPRQRRAPLRALGRGRRRLTPPADARPYLAARHRVRL